MIDESGRLHFLAFLDGAPAGQSAGRVYQWTPETGFRLQPPGPFPTLDRGCELGIQDFGLGQGSAYFLFVRSVGDLSHCKSSALLRPNEDGSWTELFQVPGSAPDDSWRLGRTELVGVNRSSEALLKTSEFKACDGPGICNIPRREALYRVDASGVLDVYLEGVPAPGVGVPLPGLPTYTHGDAASGPDELGQVVVDVALGIDGEHAPAIYRWDPDVGLELMVLAGDPAQGIPGVALKWVGASVLNGTGAITFWARLAEGPGVSENDDDTIWTVWPSGEMELRFRESASSGAVLRPISMNEQGEVAFVTESPSRVLWGPDPDGQLVVRAVEGDPLPGSAGGTLDAFELSHLSDAGEVLIHGSERIAYYKVDASDVLSVLVDGVEPIVPPPGARVRAYLAFDPQLEHLALGVWTQATPGPFNTSTILVPVPEPAATSSSYVALVALALLRRKLRTQRVR